MDYFRMYNGGMSFRIVRNDISKVKADAIVNTANEQPFVGSGIDSVIYNAAGINLLLNARKKIGVINKGDAKHTPSFNLKKNGIKYIIHTVGTIWEGGDRGEIEILRNCYRNSFKIASSLRCKSIAVPFLATGNFGFPKEKAIEIALDEINNFLDKKKIEIILVVFDKQSILISQKLFDDIETYIDDNYKPSNSDNLFLNSIFSATSHLAGVVGNDDLNTFLKKEYDSETFRDKLLGYIASKNLSNADIYKTLHMQRQYFSKIINPKKERIPIKNTVMALGLAIGLNIDEFNSFLSAAGYGLKNSSELDLIVKYCVINKIPYKEFENILIERNLPSLI